jgi:pyruvate dehydrogenase E2 component (dihydrolipoamide acetyltransferase)
MTEGTLVKWCKKVGDKLSVGDVIAEVETDKATMEMEAFDDGEIIELLVTEGQTIKLGDKMAVFKIDGEATDTPSAATASPSAQKPAAAAPSAPAHAKSAGSSSTNGSRIKISPLARKIATEKGIDASTLSGSGPGGRIVRRDVLEAPAQPVSAQKAAPQPPSQTAPQRAVSAAPVITGAESIRIPLTNMRKIIAERLLASKTQIPHFYLNIDVDAAPLMKLRAQLNVAAEAEGFKFTVNDLILRAAILAAVQVPKVNSSYTSDAIIQYNSVHLSVAIAVEDGLVTPVIRDAQKKSLREINSAVKDLATRAKSKRLKPEEFQGGTITVSNLGSFGIDSFSAIINPPQSIILAVGAIVKKPVVGAGDQIVVGQRLSLGLSCDHRSVDGAVGSEYLAALRKLVESPTLMLI